MDIMKNLLRLSWELTKTIFTILMTLVDLILIVIIAVTVFNKISENKCK